MLRYTHCTQCVVVQVPSLVLCVSSSPALYPGQCEVHAERDCPLVVVDARDLLEGDVGGYLQLGRLSCCLLLLPPSGAVKARVVGGEAEGDAVKGGKVHPGGGGGGHAGQGAHRLLLFVRNRGGNVFLRPLLSLSPKLSSHLLPDAAAVSSSPIVG